MDVYDITKAEEVKIEGQVVGYLFQVNEETYLPLNRLGKLLGPPSYKKDARMTVVRSNESSLQT